jgi:hypothetical protein
MFTPMPDQPGFMFMLGRPFLVAKLWFVVVLMNNNVKLVLLLLYLHLILEHFIC